MGEWKDDKRHGKGKVIYPPVGNGIPEEYDGDWYEGKMHGWGRYIYPDGSVYEGEWLNSQVL